MKQTLLPLLLMLLPMVASADAVEINGIYYNLINKGYIAEVTSKPDGYIGSVIIPEKIEYEGVEYSVTSIGREAFRYCGSLTFVTISNSVTNIGFGAFEDSGLVSVKIPDSVTSMGDYVFAYCSDLTSVTIGNGVTRIGVEAFYGCSSLTSVTIGNGVTGIGDYAFDGCSGLSSITIGNSVTRIGKYAFSGCRGLTFVSIGSGVTSIGYRAFAWCSSLTSITIGNSVTNIGEGAFQYCSNLSSATIGESVRQIYSNSFANCQQLADVYCLAEDVPNTDTDAFKESYIEYATLHVPESSIEAYKTTGPWNGFKEIVKIMPMFTLTYIVDGEVYRAYQVEEKTTITLEAAPYKEGYTFSGWSEIPETMPAKDVTVTGSFTINKYKLIYLLNGEEYKVYELEYGSAITPEADLTKDGYTFSGWSWVPTKMPAEDVTVTGSLTANKHKLTYMVDGVEFKSYEVDYGSSITPEEEPTKEGYTFSGWSWIPKKMPDEDVTVVGTFIVNKYKLTYMIDNEVYKVAEYDYGATITPEGKPEGDYVTFVWKDVPETMPAKDVTVYADYETGIAEVLMAQGIKYIYAPNGKRIEKLRKGLNIVVMNDGSVRKVVVK